MKEAEVAEDMTRLVGVQRHQRTDFSACIHSRAHMQTRDGLLLIMEGMDGTATPGMPELLGC